MATDGGVPPLQHDELGLASAIEALRKSVEAKLRSSSARSEHPVPPSDELEALHRALEELRVGWENLQAQSLQAVQERERYLELFRLAPDAYVVADTYGVITEVNLAAQELLRFTPFNLTKRPLELFIATDHRAAFRTNWNAMLAQGTKTAQRWSSALGRGGVRTLPVDITVKTITFSGGAMKVCCVLRRQGEPGP